MLTGNLSVLINSDLEKHNHGIDFSHMCSKKESAALCVMRKVGSQLPFQGNTMSEVDIG